MAYISQYSTRPETFAVLKMKDDVLKKDKKERDRKLTEILKKQVSKKHKKYIGKILDVLVLERKKDYYVGKSWEYKSVKFKSDKNLIGRVVKVKIDKALAWGLEGKEHRDKLIVVLGPTASGKTELAYSLSKKVNGELISADSRQVYRRMDIGTAKNKKIKQHLIDIVDVKEEYNASLFKKDSLLAIDEILKKGKIPILVGGTGLYISAIVDNIEFPKIKADKKLRKELESKTIEELFNIYKKIDKEGAKIIDSKNKRRLVRAIEVVMQTKESFFKCSKKDPLFDILEIGIDVQNEELKKRIDKRVDQMIKKGLEKEVKSLPLKAPILETIGYREWKEYSDKKEIIERIKINTFKFAKRQKTWFKRDKRIHWIKKYSEAEKLAKKFIG